MSQSEVIKNLCKWLKTESFNDSSLKLFESTNPNEGRCVLAAKTFQENDVILKVPLKFLINYTSSLDILDLKQFFEWCFNLTTQHYQLTRIDALYLYLLYEYNDSKSHLNAFISSFPKEYDTPENFDTAIISALPTNLRQSVQTRVVNLKFKYENIKDLLHSYAASVEISNNMKKLLNNLTISIFNWIYCCVNTRCFHLDEMDFIEDKDRIQYFNKLFGSLNRNLDRTKFKSEWQEIDNLLCCLIPFLDFMNHSFGLSNVDCDFDKENKCYLLQAKSNIGVNDQIYGTYGYHDNKMLLIEYGFILEDNPYDHISFDKNDFKKLALDVDKFEFFWQKVIENKLNTDLTCNLDPGPSWSLIKLIDFLCCFNESDKAEFCDYDFLREPNEIKIYFEKLLVYYKIEIDNSIKELGNICFVTNEYHLKLCRMFCQLQLNILKKNFDILNDDNLWLSLF
jgi:hypothetical protein